MRRWISLLLMAVMLLSSLTPVALAEDSQEPGETVIVETLASDEADSPADEADGTSDEAGAEENETPNEDGAEPPAGETGADETDEAAPGDEDTLTGETGDGADQNDADAGDGEEAQDEGEGDEAQDDGETEEDAQEEFIVGYVRVLKRAKLCETMNDAEVYATLAEDNVLYAELARKSSSAENDWFALTVETEETKAREEKFLTLYIRFRDIAPLSKAEAEALVGELLLDETVRLYRNNPMPVTQIRIVAAQGEDPKGPESGEAEQPEIPGEDAQAAEETVSEPSDGIEAEEDAPPRIP